MIDNKAKATKGKAARNPWVSIGLTVAVMVAGSLVLWASGKGLIVGAFWAAIVFCMVILAPLAAVSALVERVRDENPAEVTAQGKPYPKWKLWLRRTVRPTPFWRKHMDDQLSDDFGVPLDTGASYFDMGGPFLDGVLFIFFAGVFIAGLVQFVIAPIFLSEGFWQHGLAYPIADALAGVCRVTGQCDFHYLIGGLAVGLILLTAVVCAAVLPMSDTKSAREAERDALAADLVSNLSNDIAEAVGVLDKRLVRFRADFVLAGILPLSLEEQEEAADAAIEAGAAPPPDDQGDGAPTAGPLPYARPELPDDYAHIAMQSAVKLTSNRTTADQRKAIAALLLENAALAKECNDHRTARGLVPLPTVEN